jgi:hypothetical protein
MGISVKRIGVKKGKMILVQVLVGIGHVQNILINGKTGWLQARAMIKVMM